MRGDDVSVQCSTGLGAATCPLMQKPAIQAIWGSDSRGNPARDATAWLVKMATLASSLAGIFRHF